MKINNNTIVKDSDPFVRQKSLDVELPLSKEDEQLMIDMLEYVDKSTDSEIAEKENLRPAVGISAVQVGALKKMTAIIIKDENGNTIHKYALVNPKIVKNSLEQVYLSGGEGCLSVETNHQGYIYRSNKIKVKAYDYLQKKDIEIYAEGYLAIVLQHELDHFKGILFYDHINKGNPFEIKENSIEI